MKRTFALAAAVGLAALSLFGVAAPALAGSSQDFYKFSDGVKPWVAGADSPKYITKYTLYHKVEYAPTTQANGYAALTNRDAHAVWMQVPVQNPGNIVEIALDARSDDSCERCALLIYVGNAAPTSPWDFQKLDDPLTKAWEHHTLKLVMKPSKDLVVAIGIMNLDYGTGLKQVAGIDNVSIVTYDMTDAKGN
jgi:hypothetical protein